MPSARDTHSQRTAVVAPGRKHLLLPQQLLKLRRKKKDYPFHRLRQVYSKSSLLTASLCFIGQNGVTAQSRNDHLCEELKYHSWHKPVILKPACLMLITQEL